MASTVAAGTPTGPCARPTCWTHSISSDLSLETGSSCCKGICGDFLVDVDRLGMLA